MSLLNELKDRWVAEEPKLFKKIVNIALTLGAPATSIWFVNQTMSLHLPDIILNVCKYIIAASAGMGLTAKLTKRDEDKDEH